MKAQNVNSLFVSLHSAIVARNVAKGSRDNDIALAYMMKNETGIKKGFVRFPEATIETLIKMQDPTAKGTEFIAVKANVKVLQALCAIGAKNVARFDSYSGAIIANTLHNSGVLFAKSALMSLCSDIEYAEFDQTQIIKSRTRKAVSTASTQRSSTREMLRALGLAVTVKGAKDDTINMTEKGDQLLRALFKGETIEDDESELEAA